MPQTNRTILTALTALVVVVLIGGCEKPPVKYTDAEHTYSFSYPASWKIESNAPLILLTGDGSGTAMPSKVFAIRQAAPWGTGWALSSANFDDIQGGFLRGLAKQQVENAKVESSSDTTLGGTPARSVIVTGHSAKFGSDVKMIMLFCVHDGAVYTITGSAAPDRFDRVRDDVTALVSSFQILQK